MFRREEDVEHLCNGLAGMGQLETLSYVVVVVVVVVVTCRQCSCGSSSSSSSCCGSSCNL